MIINTSPNLERCELHVIKKMVELYNLTGDIVEFGTFSCESAINLATSFKDRKIYTIDHFEGLEKTSKNLPIGSDWSEGMFNLSHPEFIHNSRVPKTKEEALLFPKVTRPVFAKIPVPPIWLFKPRRVRA